MDPIWLLPLLAVLAALTATGLAVRGLRRDAEQVGTAVAALGEARARLGGLADAAAELRDSGHPSTRR